MWREPSTAIPTWKEKAGTSRRAPHEGAKRHPNVPLVYGIVAVLIVIVI